MILHPQKRRLLKEGVTAIIGRLIEVKHILVDLECSDIFNYNDVLLDLNLSHESLRIPVPRFIYEEKKEETESRNALLKSLNAKEFKTGKTNIFFPVLSLNDAIKLIQKNERGRQSKQRAQYIKGIQAEAQQEKLMMASAATRQAESDKAAIVIQKNFRGYLARTRATILLLKEQVFLGMAHPVKDTTQKDKLEETLARRKVLRFQYEEDYCQALLTTKEKILRIEGPDMKEVIQDDFRQWYMEYKRINGKFPDFPEEEVWAREDFKFSVDGSLPPLPSAKSEEKSKEKADSKKNAKKEDADPLLQFKAMGESDYLDSLQKHVEAFDDQWRYKDESENFSQKHDQDIIKDKKRAEVQNQIKSEVFALLEDELTNLKLAVEKDSKKKGKGGKGKGKGKGKKDKKGGKKGKKEKDLTANRTTESLVEELIKTGILQSYLPMSFNSWVGNFNIVEPLITKDLVITPSLNEIQRVIIEYGVLPLGVPTIEDEPPKKYPKVASLLLYGASGTGKSKLVQSLASELGAGLFNLSPKNTAGEFMGKANVTKMVHMVFKIARLQAPSVIYIEGIEMIFAKKIPKDDTSDPKRLKKDLTKAIKLIRDHSERVILIGASTKPWEGDVKAMLPLFDKVLYCPLPDYGSRYSLWNHFISRKTEHHAGVSMSLLARMSNNLSTGVIEMVVDRVMTTRRLEAIKMRPLATDEFVTLILELPRQNPDEINMFTDFAAKVAKKREQMLTGPVDEASSKPKKK